MNLVPLHYLLQPIKRHMIQVRLVVLKLQGNYPAITTTDPVTYGKHNVRFDCMPGARINDFLSGQVLGNFLEALIPYVSCFLC